MPLEVVFHGRGGQGAVTAAEIMVKALSLEGKYGQSQAKYGIERRGAPVQAFLRVDDQPISIRSRIRNPDCVVVLDPKLHSIVDVGEGLKDGGAVVLNIGPGVAIRNLRVKISKKGRIDAIKLSYDIFGRRPIPITNTIMLGALAAVTNIVQKESLISAIRAIFTGDLKKKNETAVTLGYEQTEVEIYG